MIVMPNGDRIITIRNHFGIELTTTFPKNFPIRTPANGMSDGNHACMSFGGIPLCLFLSGDI